MSTEKLPKAFKKKWVDALLSGEYKQGEGDLLHVGKYCCLGVACVVAGVRKHDMLNKGLIYTYEEYSEKVPAILRVEATEAMYIYRSTVPGALADLNDSEVPFEVIAGVINEYL